LVPRLRYIDRVKLSRLLLACGLAFAAAEIPTIQPQELVSHLAAKPAIFQVGPNVLYRSKHIPASLFAGPGSKPEGLALLRGAVQSLPRGREIVIYCGCCPWDRCPNISPAIALLKEMGFTHVKALYLSDNFKTNWIDRNYPVE
jgi:thiosulfate/3-mercaptopyruvate sulfurtransferase